MNKYLDLIALVALLTLVSVDILKNRKQIKSEKIIFLRHFTKFIKRLEMIVHKNRKFFNVLSLVSLIISLPTTILISYMIVSSIIKLQPTVALVLPTVADYKYPGPVVSVPFFYWIISIFLIVFFHETMHAIVALNNNIKVKKYGLIYLLLIPIGAFVDLDEKMLKKSKISSRIKVYAAGSLGNFLLALIIFALAYFTTFIFSLTVEEKGVYFESTIPNTPASEVNLSGIIIQINETKIRNLYDLHLFLRNTSPGDVIKIYTTEGEYILRLAQIENRSYIGINKTRTYFTYKNSDKPLSDNILALFSQLMTLYKWVFLLSLGIGLANMLPIVPLDGGLILKDIMIKLFGENRGKKIASLVSVIFILLILFSLFLYLRSQVKVF